MSICLSTRRLLIWPGTSKKSCATSAVINKYTLGTELRDCSRKVLKHIIEANASRVREPMLHQLRQDLEWFKVLARLCHEAGGFASTRAYLYVSEQVVGIAKQNEGWLRQTSKTRQGRAARKISGEAGHGRNRKG